MRSVQEHLAAVLAAVGPVAPLDVVLGDAAGCILAEDIAAPWPVPPRAVAGCDGYALVSADVATVAAGVPVELPVVHDVAVTASSPIRLVPGTAVRVVSGAPVPAGADAVVPMEHTASAAARIAVQVPVRRGDNIRQAGSEAAEGDVVLSAGTRLGPRQLALSAALGRGRVPVHPRPRVVVIAVGDELVEPGTPPQDGRVFDATSNAVTEAVQETGASVFRVGVVGDERWRLRETVEDQLVRADLMITTGGLSDAVEDTVASVLSGLGPVGFDHVAMAPGRRQGFGGLGEDAQVPVFALPGHPAAALVCFEVFVRPALLAMAGYAELYRTSVPAACTGSWVSPSGLRQFVPVHLTGSPEEGYHAAPTGDPDILTVRALSQANALAVVSEQVSVVHAGDRVHCMVMDG